MKIIIKELQRAKDHELSQIGLTPRTGFDGTQEQHDAMHRDRAEEYSIAIDTLLSSKSEIQKLQLKITDLEQYIFKMQCEEKDRMD